MKTIFDWHNHHDVLLEPRVGTKKERIRYIIKYKPPAERPLRLKLFKRVKGKLPARLVKASDATIRAGNAFIRNRATYTIYNEALKTYKKILAECMPQIKKLHTKECPNCPWDGKTIFSKGA